MQNSPDVPLQKPMSLHEFKKRRRLMRNINVEMRENLTRMNRLAVWITNHVGTMGFFLLIFVWTVAWLGWNTFAPPQLQFDAPMGFVFWLFLSNLLQILLMPLIMVGQNVIGRHAEARAEHDLQINIKNEQEIEVILHHLEHQNEILVAMMRKLGVENRRGPGAGEAVTIVVGGLGFWMIGARIPDEGDSRVLKGGRGWERAMSPVYGLVEGEQGSRGHWTALSSQEFRNRMQRLNALADDLETRQQGHR